jgi:hypothetical protein
MYRHQDDAQVQEKACGALCDLADSDANQVTLMAAEAHVRIIGAMDRHQDDAQVQEKACNNANQVTLVAAEAHVRIIRAMDRHQDDARVQLEACSALWSLAVNDANQVTLVAAEAHRTYASSARWTGTKMTRECSWAPARRSITS